MAAHPYGCHGPAGPPARLVSGAGGPGVGSASHVRCARGRDMCSCRCARGEQGGVQAGAEAAEGMGHAHVRVTICLGPAVEPGRRDAHHLLTHEGGGRVATPGAGRPGRPGWRGGEALHQRGRRADGVGNARGGFLPTAATASDGASRAQRAIQTLVAGSGFKCLRPEHGGGSLHVPVSRGRDRTSGAHRSGEPAPSDGAIDGGSGAGLPARAATGI